MSAKFISIFFDESTTNSIKTRPVYCEEIGVTEKFDLFMWFIGQTFTSGFESVKMYFDAVKAVCEVFCVWNNIKIMETEGCHYMRSTAKYVGLNAHGKTSGNFISHMNRNVPPKSFFAFNSILHIMSRSVVNCLKYLPPFWIKHTRIIYTYF